MTTENKWHKDKWTSEIINPDNKEQGFYFEDGKIVVFDEAQDQYGCSTKVTIPIEVIIEAIKSRNIEIK